jgi:hypothetical protein
MPKKPRKSRKTPPPTMAPGPLIRVPNFHVHNHPALLRRIAPGTKDEIETAFGGRGWAKGKALTGPGIRARIVSHAGQQDAIVLEDTATGQVRVFRETRRDVNLIIAGKLPPA